MPVPIKLYLDETGWFIRIPETIIQSLNWKDGDVLDLQARIDMPDYHNRNGLDLKRPEPRK
jgi:hypothetical protein